MNRSKMAVWTDRSGSGWKPIGSCTSATSCTAYAAVFDGRNYVIADLFISVDNNVNGVGLFGAFNGSLQNVHLQDARISGGREHVGGLVGYGADARFENLSVTAGSLRTSLGTAVGSMIGSGNDAEISHSYVVGGTVSGRNNVGGLVGQASHAEIHHSYVTGTTVSSNGNAGGLAGFIRDGDIRYSYTADVTLISGDNLGLVGGLAGEGRLTEIRYSYAIGVNISGTGRDDNFAGLAGEGAGAVIHASYAAGFIFPNSFTGGLAGVGGASNISYSYAAVAIPVAPADSFFQVRSLVGISTPLIVTASYWNTDIQMLSTGGGGGVGRNHCPTAKSDRLHGDGQYLRRLGQLLVRSEYGR